MNKPYSFSVRLAAWSGVAVAGVALALTGPGVAFAGSTGGSGGVGSGNQLALPISVPIDLCGNALAALGLADAECSGGAKVSTPAPSAAGSSTSGAGGVASGNQISIPVTVPINVCGNSLAVLGTAKASCQAAPQAPKPKCGCVKRKTHSKAPVHHRRPVKPRRKPVVPQRAVAPKAAALPTTGVNLAGVGAGALALAGIGGTAMAATRRRC